MINLLNFMAGPDWTEFMTTMRDLIDSLFKPLLIIAVSAVAVWALALGIKFVLSYGDEEKLKKAKGAVKAFIIGVVVIFAVMVGTPFAISAFLDWQLENTVTISMLNTIKYIVG